MVYTAEQEYVDGVFGLVPFRGNMRHNYSEFKANLPEYMHCVLRVQGTNAKETRRQQRDR